MDEHDVQLRSVWIAYTHLPWQQTVDLSDDDNNVFQTRCHEHSPMYVGQQVLSILHYQK